MSTTQSEINPLRVRRKDTAKILACSLSTIKRKEKAGLLAVLKDCPGGTVYHFVSEVQALAGNQTVGEG